MYARNVSLNLKPNSASEFTNTFERDILPVLRKQDGFKLESLSRVVEGTPEVQAYEVCNSTFHKIASQI